jgi:diguanylate cyclase (GGDEF)-like protein
VEEVLVDILSTCLSLDKKASEIYAHFSKSAKDEQIKAFWKDMSAQEQEHVHFWAKILTMAQNGMLPQVFDRPYELREELKGMSSNIDTLVKRSKRIRNTTDAFLVAYRVEFFMLHPEFQSLFHFIKAVLNEPTPGDEYEAHLKGFITALHQYGKVSPELEFLGETILRFREVSEQLALQSYIDFLTGILNRRGLFNTIIPLAYLAQRNNSHVGIMMIDIDHFKRVNDTYGHQTGDDVLKSVALMIKSSIRSSDIFGRYGGEEFLVYLSPVNPDSLPEIAEKIRRSIEKSSEISAPITVSIGVSSGIIKGGVEKAVAKIIKKADTYLYVAKNSGRNKVVITNKDT